MGPTDKQLNKTHSAKKGLLQSLLKIDENDGNCHYLEKVEVSLEKHRLALCVGAGLTAYFVGNWRELLNKLLVMRCCSTLQNLQQNELIYEGETIKLNKNRTPKDFEDYFRSMKNAFLSDSTNTLEIGEYLMFDSNDRSPSIGTSEETEHREKFFAEQVRYAIYSSMSKKTDDSAIEDYFVDLYNKKFKGKEEDIFEKETADDEINGIATLVAVVRLCIKKKIRNIISYNFDTILDKLIASKEVWELFGETLNVAVHIHTFSKTDPIMIWGDKESRNIVNIYHVHGVLFSNEKEDKSGKNNISEDIEIAPIIFSENSYQSYQKTTLNWSNIRLADTMLQYDVLCIGFSGDDANFRMLRRFLSESMSNPIMGMGNKKNKLYMMKSCGQEFSNIKDSPQFSCKPECAFASIKTYLELVSNYFRIQLGTDIIWSDGYMDMAQQIVMLSR